jgi:hypothetical protein
MLFSKKYSKIWIPAILLIITFAIGSLFSKYIQIVNENFENSCQYEFIDIVQKNDAFILITWNKDAGFNHTKFSSLDELSQYASQNMSGCTLPKPRIDNSFDDTLTSGTMDGGNVQGSSQPQSESAPSSQNVPPVLPPKDVNIEQPIVNDQLQQNVQIPPPVQYNQIPVQNKPMEVTPEMPVPQQQDNMAKDPMSKLQSSIDELTNQVKKLNEIPNMNSEMSIAPKNNEYWGQNDFHRLSNRLQNKEVLQRTRYPSYNEWRNVLISDPIEIAGKQCQVNPQYSSNRVSNWMEF